MLFFFARELQDGMFRDASAKRTMGDFLRTIRVRMYFIPGAATRARCILADGPMVIFFIILLFMIFTD